MPSRITSCACKHGCFEIVYVFIYSPPDAYRIKNCFNFTIVFLFSISNQYKGKWHSTELFPSLIIHNQRKYKCEELYLHIIFFLIADKILLTSEKGNFNKIKINYFQINPEHMFLYKNCKYDKYEHNIQYVKIFSIR